MDKNIKLVLLESDLLGHHTLVMTTLTLKVMRKNSTQERVCDEGGTGIRTGVCLVLL